MHRNFDDQLPWISEFELLDAGKAAWRNHARCIGRLNWKSLKMRDLRHLTTAEDVFESLLDHYVLAHNNGDIRTYMTVFLEQRQRATSCIRIWNSQVCLTNISLKIFLTWLLHSEQFRLLAMLDIAYQMVPFWVIPKMQRLLSSQYRWVGSHRNFKRNSICCL